MKILVNRFCSPASVGMALLNKNLRKTSDPEISICTFQIRTENCQTLGKVGSSLRRFTVSGLSSRFDLITDHVAVELETPSFHLKFVEEMCSYMENTRKN